MRTIGSFQGVPVVTIEPAYLSLTPEQIRDLFEKETDFFIEAKKQLHRRYHRAGLFVLAQNQMTAFPTHGFDHRDAVIVMKAGLIYDPNAADAPKVVEFDSTKVKGQVP